MPAFKKVEERLRIGILAEDETDCNTIEVLIRRMASEISTAPIGIDKHSTTGCGGLRKKAPAKMRQMLSEGCKAEVLVHDLDLNPNNQQLNDEEALRSLLSNLSVPTGLERLICIPVEELEAWFWADPEIIQKVGQGKGKASPSPHLIQKPKERLQKLSAAANKKPRYNTNNNPNLATTLDLTICTERCRAFKALRDFVHRIVTPSSSPAV